MVIVVQEAIYKRNERVYPAYYALSGMGISKDILVYTVDEFSSKSIDVMTLAYKIKKEGVCIYEKL